LSAFGTAATGGGGGGAGGAGASSTNNISGFASSGVGLVNAITGSSITYATGGRGAGDSTTGSLAGAANSGSGGDGVGTPNTGKDGGSGIVVVRYLTAELGSFTTTGGTKTTAGAYTVHTFTSSGSLVIA
jgi:hypothetical protein